MHPLEKEWRTERLLWLPEGLKVYNHGAAALPGKISSVDRSQEVESSWSEHFSFLLVLFKWYIHWYFLSAFCCITQACCVMHIPSNNASFNPLLIGSWICSKLARNLWSMLACFIRWLYAVLNWILVEQVYMGWWGTLIHLFLPDCIHIWHPVAIWPHGLDKEKWDRELFGRLIRWQLSFSCLCAFTLYWWNSKCNLMANHELLNLIQKKTQLSNEEEAEFS